MNIKSLVLAIEICHKAGVSLHSWGPRGIGKSIAPRKYCSSRFHFEGNKVPYGFVDIRAAQIEASEIRGIPKEDAANNRYIYLVMDALPQHEFIDENGNTFGRPGDVIPEVSPFYSQIKMDAIGTEAELEAEELMWPLKGKVEYYHGILFLDEPNRGEDDVLQALFELVLDGKTGGYKLPTKWGIYGAGNPSTSKYRVNVTASDTAYVSRWCHVPVTVNDEYISDWMQHMFSLGLDSGIIDKITQFTTSDRKNLVDVTEQCMDDLPIEPNPRSWEMVARVESVINHMDTSPMMEEVRREILQGLIGTSFANQYINWSLKIHPNDIINNGIDDKNLKKLTGLERVQLLSVIWGVVSLAANKTSEEKIKNVLSFIKWLTKGNKDLAVALAMALIADELGPQIKGIAIYNKSMQKLISKSIDNKIWYKAITNDEILKAGLGNIAWGTDG